MGRSSVLKFNTLKPRHGIQGKMFLVYHTLKAFHFKLETSGAYIRPIGNSPSGKKSVRYLLQFWVAHHGQENIRMAHLSYDGIIVKQLLYTSSIPSDEER